MAKEIQINQLNSLDKIDDSDVLVIEVGTTTYKINAKVLIDYVKTHQDIKDVYIENSEIGVANGIVPLDSTSKIDAGYLTFGEVANTIYEGSQGKLLEGALDTHKSDTSNPHNVTKEQIELGNVENKSSETIRSEITAKDIENALGYVPEIDGVYEQATGYTDAKIAELIDSAPETLNTLKEISDTLADNEEAMDAINAAIGEKATQLELDTHISNTVLHTTQTDKNNLATALSHANSTHARTDATKTSKSTTNGNVLVNDTETVVYQHPLSGVTAGTYRQVTVDSQGHITGGNNTTLPITQGGTGATSATQALINLGVNATADELNKLDGATVLTEEINQLKGVTSPIQTQLDGKASSSHGIHVPDVVENTSGMLLSSDGTNAEWKALTDQDIINALGYTPGTGSIVYTSVKGDAETEYRTGEVNITKANIGLGKVDNTSDSEKAVLSASKLSSAVKIGNADFNGSQSITLEEMGAASKTDISTLNNNLTMRYNAETDMVQICFEGEWVDWKAGNLAIYDNLCLLENVTITASSQFSAGHAVKNLLSDDVGVWISSGSTAYFTISLPNICAINNMFLSSNYTMGYTYYDCTITVQVSEDDVVFESVGTYALAAKSDKTIDLNNIQAKAIRVIYNSHTINSSTNGDLVMCRYVKLMGRSMV